MVHGKDDKIVNPKNSFQLIKQWAYLVNTDTLPSKTTLSFAGNADITKNVYEDKNDKAQLFYYEIKNLGHALVIDPGAPITQGGETGFFSVDKDFFSTYWIAKDFGLIK